MPVPSTASVPSPKVFQALERAEQELKAATDSLSLVGRQLNSLREIVQDETLLAAAPPEQPELPPPPPVVPTVGTRSSRREGHWGSISLQVADPPGLVLHRHNKEKLKNKQVVAAPRFRRVSHVQSSGANSQGLRLHGRWMELSTHASADVSVRDNRDNRKAMTQLRSRTHSGETMDSDFASCIPIFHPQGVFKLCWDLIALALLLNDSVLLPPALAWDITMDDPGGGGFYVAVSFYVSLVFWTFDLAVNLNTAVFMRGTLVVSRRHVVYNYARSWMMFDLFVLVLDYTYIALSADIQVLRFVRILRVLRLVRIIKLSKLNTMIEESAASAGRQWVTLIVAITKTAVVMLMAAHFLTCAWYWIGMNLGPPNVNWLYIPGAEEIPGWVQYLHSLRWIMNAPSPPDIDPASGIERGIDIFIAVVTLVVIGSAISKISGTMAELRAMNEESDRRRRDVRLYLAGQAVSYSLVTRIMRFVDYKLEKFSTSSLDSSLISPTLQLELYVSQRADYLGRMPIFALTQECFPEVFGSICAALQKYFFEKGEQVFSSGSWAERLHLTGTGTYSYAKSMYAEPVKLEGMHWFSEITLYAAASVHESTLVATSFAETFSLAGPDLVECVKHSRGCVAMFCEYAKDFIAGMQKTNSKLSDEDQVLQGEACCRQNQHFQALYPDPAKLFKNITVYEREEEDQEEDTVASPGSSKTDSKTDSKGKEEEVGKHSPLGPRTASGVLSRLSSESSPAASFISHVSNGVSKRDSMVDPGLGTFVHDVMGLGSLDAEALPKQLQRFIPELDPEHSPHVRFEQAVERDRGESSCMSVLALVKNEYDIFTQPQGKNVKLLASQWHELQELVEWIEPDPQEVQAVLVLLSIRGLGKSKVVLQQLPAESRRPERAVVQLMHSHQNVVPSVRWLTERSFRSVEETLWTHELFNLAQMLQGENCPANVKQLREHIEEKGDSVFRFYILFLLGFMSGLAGGNGSRFMNAKNADSTIGGIRMLQRLMNVDPTKIYWGYMGLRATKLALPFDTPEDMVLLRLVCLARIQDDRGYKALKASWHALGARERTSLTDHFLADGIEESAWVLEFLPNCVANAQANPVIGLTPLLDVLADLLFNLRAQAKPKPELMLVDLSDLGEFILAVQNRFVFLTCISRCQLNYQDTRVRVEMTGGNWGRTTDPETDLTTMAYTLQDLVQKQQFMEERLGQMG